MEGSSGALLRQQSGGRGGGGGATKGMVEGGGTVWLHVLQLTLSSVKGAFWRLQIANAPKRHHH